MKVLDVEVVDDSSFCFETSQLKNLVLVILILHIRIWYFLYYIAWMQILSYTSCIGFLLFNISNARSSYMLVVFVQVKEKAFSLDSNGLECVDNEPEFDNLVRPADI